jgi:hypothetical protein
MPSGSSQPISLAKCCSARISVGAISAHCQPASMAMAGGQRGHHRLAAAHVALQQAVHGHGARQVARDFLAHAPLRAGQLKRQGRQQRSCRPPGAAHSAGARRCIARAPRLQLRQLLRQQLLGLQALPGRVAVVFQLGQRHLGRRVVQKL